MPLPGRAAEHITLRNGFELDCTARDVVDGHVRLYLGEGTTDYMDVTPESILRADPLAATEQVLATVATKAPLSGSQPAPRTEYGKAPTFATGRLGANDVHTLAQQAGRAHNIDADLLSSIIHAESGGDVHAISRTGARGLMQLMPATATAMGVADSFAPEQNVAGGTAYLDRLLTLYHDDIVLAVAAYNAGPGAVARFHGVPPFRETRAYVARVVGEFNRRKLATR